MRWLLAVLALLPLAATAQPRIVSGSGSYATGPRILGEPAFAFELDALEQAEVSRPGWPVTTTRASTRMCFTGTAWQTVPENTPCIGVWGLASFGAGTNYWPDSTSFAGWSNTGAAGNTAEDKGDHWAFLATANGAFRDPSPRGLDVTAGQTIIATCELRSSNGATVRVEPGPTFIAGSSSPIHTLTSEWKRYSSAAVAALAAGLTKPYLYDITTGEQVDARQCQLEKSPTPGPRHDCGGSACSWQGDVHTVSTAGWPVAAGEVRLQYTPLAVSSDSRWLVDAATFNTAGWELYIRNGSSIALLTHGAGANSVYESSALTWVAGQTYEIRVVWGAGVVRMWRDGVLVRDSAAPNMPAGPLPAVAHIGTQDGSSFPANGHIRLLRVSQ